MIAIIDYDIGNIAAVVNMLQRLGQPCKVTANTTEVEQAERIILPGNGAFDACMHNLRASGLLPVLERQVLQRGVPLLGICVGAQMLGSGSAEGVALGLGWLDMRVERFPALPDLRVPHMGWNHVAAAQANHPLTQDMTADTRFYFVHSYYMQPKNSANILLSAHYGIEFAAGVVQGNIAGVQFHPEKSHRFGKQLLSAFARWVP
ncbi:imidazole glycerol phosphate synthase subunit HisH [Acidovorax sp. 210-6]|uniref:imidazole glycerol phosphate synthase subunit HisH n=1 Tax=Acidovorax sp. 210-6 TaxID=2699468 RepID=UPI00138A65F6|nr:imidazole glycerol phosphate synthase subunit HisH [Acidovorax sp. 210-6]NCU65124.1 imidazole glycerol phosphate synthase subunit HisH [Acidovorax sp. 210-6]